MTKSIKFLCPSCQCRLRAKEIQAGKTVRCPKCNARVVVDDWSDVDQDALANLLLSDDDIEYVYPRGLEPNPTILRAIFAVIHIPDETERKDAALNLDNGTVNRESLDETENAAYLVAHGQFR